MNNFLNNEDQVMLILLCIPRSKCIAQYIIGAQWECAKQTSELGGSKTSWL